MDDMPVYTCAECGHHFFRVEYYFTLRTESRAEIPCGCEREEEYASTRIVVVTQGMVRYGLLGEDHRVDWEGPAEEVDSEKETMDAETLCEDCVEDAVHDQSLEEWEELESEQLDEEDEWYVKCDKCGREIEFGWSHPDRGGRFWPCESTDFNPWKCWPEPRFRMNWLEKGWLRPEVAKSLREHLAKQEPPDDVGEQ